MKVCSKCQVHKEAFAFGKRDGNRLRSWCNECLRTAAAERKATKAEYDKQRYAMLADKIKNRVKQYSSVPDRKEAKKLYDKARHPKLAAERRERYATDLNFRLTCNLRSRLYSALKRSTNKRASKVLSTFELVGCTPSELQKHLEALFPHGMTWQHVLDGQVHIDHKRPCASFDLTNPQEQEACFHYTNLQPLWARDNLRKGDRF